MTPGAGAAPVGPWSASDLAARLGAEVRGDGAVVLARIESIDGAGPDALTFIRDSKYAARWSASRAGGAIVTRGLDAELDPGPGRALLIVDDADLALAQLLELIAPEHVAPAPGVHAAASIDPTATLGRAVRIGPHVSVGPGSVIGDGVVLCPGVRIGAGVRIGDGCDLRAGVVIEDRCTLGRRVIIHPNAVIGADGFGYRAGPRGLVKIPHAGGVTIGDEVEIGACAAIDRGKLGDTRVGDGTKIDNHCQIGHNCEIGRGCILCGQVGLAGSVRVGDYVTLGGGVAVRDNVRIGARAKVGARSGVMTDIPDGEDWVGAPAGPYRESMRSYAAVRSLPETLKRIERALRRLGAPPDTE